VTYIKKIIIIKTHFQLEKDMFEFLAANAAGERMTMGRCNMRFSNFAEKCSRDVRASSAGTRTLARNRTINRKFPRANDFLRVCTSRCAFANGRAHVAHARLSTMSRDKHPFCLLKINRFAASNAFYKICLKRAKR